jgi:sec-independent protein translocase protein TatC
MALHFLLGFQGNLGGVQQEALPSVGNYLTFVMQFMFGFGLAFLTPVLLMLLERAGIVTRKQLVGFRRYAIVVNTGIAALLSPPDIGSMILLGIPLILLYELALAAMWFTERRSARTAEEPGTAIVSKD